MRFLTEFLLIVSGGIAIGWSARARLEDQIRATRVEACRQRHPSRWEDTSRGTWDG